MKTFDKYKRNLKYDETGVYSYNTKVADIRDNRIVQRKWYSMTTQKHIRYAAKELGLILIEVNKNGQFR